MSLVELYTPEEVAKATKLTPQTIREMCQRKELRGTKLAGKWRIYPESVEAWLAAGEPEPGVLQPIHRAPRHRLPAERRKFRAMVGGKA